MRGESVKKDEQYSEQHGRPTVWEAGCSYCSANALTLLDVFLFCLSSWAHPVAAPHPQAGAHPPPTWPGHSLILLHRPRPHTEAPLPTPPLAPGPRCPHDRPREPAGLHRPPLPEGPHRDLSSWGGAGGWSSWGRGPNLEGALAVPTSWGLWSTLLRAQPRLAGLPPRWTSSPATCSQAPEAGRSSCSLTGQAPAAAPPPVPPAWPGAPLPLRPAFLEPGAWHSFGLVRP